MSTSAARMPDCINIGPARTATSWLQQALVGHVGLPAGGRETDFFTTNYGKGLDWYLGLFRDCDPALPIFEKGGYFEFPAARARIKTHIPNCRIICTLRDPVDRVYSYYKLLRCHAYTKLDFEAALENRIQLVESGRYGTYLEAWLNEFGRENVLIAIYDDLRANPQAYLDRISDFIGIARIPLDSSPLAVERVNQFERMPYNHKLAQNARHLRQYLTGHFMLRTYGLLGRAGVWRFCFEGGPPFPKVEPEVDARVRELFRPEVEKLEGLIGRDLSAWKQPRNRQAGIAPNQQSGLAGKLSRESA